MSHQALRFAHAVTNVVNIIPSGIAVLAQMLPLNDRAWDTWRVNTLTKLSEVNLWLETTWYASWIIPGNHYSALRPIRIGLDQLYRLRKTITKTIGTYPEDAVEANDTGELTDFGKAKGVLAVIDTLIEKQQKDIDNKLETELSNNFVTRPLRFIVSKANGVAWFLGGTSKNHTRSDACHSNTDKSYQPRG